MSFEIILKMLFLRHTFGLSDEQVEDQLIDRLSFQGHRSCKNRNHWWDRWARLAKKNNRSRAEKPDEVNNNRTKPPVPQSKKPKK
ncbi:MAG: transposase [Cyclobacteriaceae bacterium]